MQYFTEWENTVAERDGFTPAQKAKMLLSKETLSRLRITGNSGGREGRREREEGGGGGRGGREGRRREREGREGKGKRERDQIWLTSEE